MYRLRLPVTEFEERLSIIRDMLAEHDQDALCLFSDTNIEWASDFHHVQTERPVCLAITDDRVVITVPRLEADRAKSDEYPLIDEVYFYYDYPGGNGGTYYEHPSDTPESKIAEMLDALGVDVVAADANGAPGTYGYSGPDLDELANIEVSVVEWVSELRKKKSDQEFELMRESAKWGNLAHQKLEEYAAPGRYELWVGMQASLDASVSLFETLGETWVPKLRGGFPAYAGLISGPNTANPHGHNQPRKLQEGDNIITWGASSINGYTSELERTMFIGDPSDEQRHYFDIMLETQQVALDTAGPGVDCSTVDQAVHDYLNEQGIVEYAQHHTGHNLGMDIHEREFIDRGSDEVMQPGHAYSIEPGIYIPDHGGYRHSDTILITEEKAEVITYFPRDIEDNIIDI